MAKPTRYRQCLLEKPVTHAVLQRTAYLPECFARLNQPVQLREEDGTWTDGWIVHVVGELTDEPTVMLRARRYKKIPSDCF